MNGEKFSLMQYPVSAILGFIEADDFIIPEIQRPFVWKRSQVRDLIDSLYNGYPTGYIITWKNPDVMTKDGQKSNGKKILIDGQQRITALMAAIVGKEVLDSDFNKDRIKIAFNPFPEDESKRFAVQDASHLKDKRWIPDISELFKPGFKMRAFENQYGADNPDVDLDDLADVLSSLTGIENRQIGVIELDQKLDMDVVTEIFIRINSKGTMLSQSDFVMSKMAADGDFGEGHGGSLLRKTVDYFCHLAVKPEFYSTMARDKQFAGSKYADKIKWLESSNDDIYDPDYDDMIRVSFMHKFGRGRLSDLVSLLSGRDFKTQQYLESVVVDSYRLLDEGVLDFINQYNFEQFVLAVRGAGFISPRLLGSKMALDFAFTLFLMLKADPSIEKSQIKRYVQKWFVLSMLTSRYTGSPESVMDRDMRNIAEKGFLVFQKENEDAQLSESFWEVTLPQYLETSSTTSPAFNVFLAAQVNLNCNSFLMRGTRISDLITISGDVHHIFPKAYLKRNGMDSKVRYNQVANFIYLDTQVNKAVGDDAPNTYFAKIQKQCQDKQIVIGNIASEEDLLANLAENCIPAEVIDMTVDDYDAFLLDRRKMMARLIEKYYKGL